jgi:hypothetical protein
MKFKEIYTKFKNIVEDNRKSIYVYSLLFTLIFSIFNRILGAIKESLWHESISIYYFFLVIIKGILLLYFYNSKTKNNETKVFMLIKILLIILNVFLIIPIVLLILNKRIVEMTLIPSIAIALYVTIKTSVVITQYVKRKKEDSILMRELRTINLMDVTVSILTLTNTLISVNSTEFDMGLFYLVIVTSVAGFFLNMFIVIRLKK